MMPFIRSLSELMAITKSTNPGDSINSNTRIGCSSIDSGQRKRYVKSIREKGIDLPQIPTIVRRKWTREKGAILKFFDELDYNNQIQSTYDLTLLARQNNSKKHDVA